MKKKIKKELKEKYKNYIRPRILLLSSFALIGMTIILVLIFLIWIHSLQTQDKYISFINLYEEPVNIKINNRVEGHMNFLDTYVASLNTDEPIEIRISKANDEEIKTIKIKEINDSSQVVIVPITKEKNYCYFSAKVNSLYYLNVNGENSAEIEDIQILRSESKEYLAQNLNIEENLYVFPGRSTGLKLPEGVNEKSLIAIYPIDCNKIEDEQEISNVIQMYKNYDSEEQRNYLQTQEEQIQSAPTVKELGNL